MASRRSITIRSAGSLLFRPCSMRGRIVVMWCKASRWRGLLTMGVSSARLPMVLLYSFFFSMPIPSPRRAEMDTVSVMFLMASGVGV